MADDSVNLSLIVEAFDRASGVFGNIANALDSMGRKFSESGRLASVAGADQEAALAKAQLAARNHQKALADLSLAQQNVKDVAAKSASEMSVATAAEADALAKLKVAEDNAKVAATDHAKAESEANQSHGKSKAALDAIALAAGGTALAIGDFAVHAVRSAVDFQHAMELSETQAGLSKQAVDAMGQRIVQLAPEVGQSTTDLANAFYHVASVSGVMGLTASQQFDLLKTAAKGAAVGHADLESTTNALIATVTSGIGGVHGYSDAMGQMSAIVGQGNMKMQDLAASMSSGSLSMAKAYGVDLPSLGAALATMTNQGTPADAAMTRLKMTIATLGGPTKQSQQIMESLGVSQSEITTRTQAMSDALAKSGVKYSELAADLKKPDGIVVALQDLKDHFQKAGVSSEEQAAIITRAFGGGKMGSTIVQLYGSLDQVKNAYTGILKGGKDFQKQWEATTNSAEFQEKRLKASLSAVETAVGMALLPTFQKLLNLILDVVRPFADWVTHNQTLATTIMVVVGAVAAFMAGLIVAVKVFTMAKEAVLAMRAAVLLLNTAFLTNPIVLAIMAIVAVVVLVATHWKQTKEVIAAVWNWMKEAAQNVADFFSNLWTGVVHFFEDVWNRILDFVKQWWPVFLAVVTMGISLIVSTVIKYHNEIWEFVQRIWNDISGFVRGVWDAIWNAVSTALTAVKNTVVTVFTDVVNFFRTSWDTISSIFTLAVNFVKDLVLRIFNDIWAFIKSVWDAISAYFKAVWDTITALITAALTAVKDIVTRVFTDVWGFIKSIWDTIYSFLKGTWDTIYSLVLTTMTTIRDTMVHVWSDIWAFIQSIWNTIYTFLRSTWDNIYSFVYNTVTNIRDTISRIFNDIWNTARSVWDGIYNAITAVIRNIQSAISSTLTAIESAASNAWNSIKNTAASLWDGVKTTILNVVNSIASGVKAVWDGIVSAAQTAWNKLTDIVKTPINATITVVNTFIGGADDVLSAVGLGRPIPSIPKLATGGVIPGYAPGQDTVPAMLSPGEGILTPQTTRAIGGASGINYLNALGAAAGKAIQFFDSGGVVSGGFSGGTFHGSWKDSVDGNTYQDTNPSGPHFVDAGTLTQYVNGTNSPPHGPSGASIIGGAAQSAAGAIAGLAKGFLRGALIAAANIALAGPKAAVEALPESPLFANAAKHAVLKILDGAYNFITMQDNAHGTTPPPPPAGGGLPASATGAMGVQGAPSGTLGQWIAQGLAAAGVSQAYAGDVALIIRYESAGNPNAINNYDINAQHGDPSRGLMQTIGATFNAYHVAGTSSNIYDPVANIAAGVRYAVSRYGSLSAVPGVASVNRGGAYVGYENGTLDTGPTAHLALLHPHEAVIPANMNGRRFGGVTINVYGNTIMTDADLDVLIDRIDKRFVQQVLPGAGAQMRL